MATYYLDLENSRNRAALECAKPGKSVRALVRQEENRSAPSIGATCTLSADGKVLDVMPDVDQEAHSWNWNWLQAKLDHYRR